jgi:hypothetical protein
VEKRKVKPKTKRRGKPSFDFVSSYPLDLCVHLLNSQDGQEQHHPLSLRFLPPNGLLRVEITPTDEDSCLFRVKWQDKKRRGSLLFPISYATVKGHIKRWDSQSTHVAGRIQVARWYVILNIIGWLIIMTFFIAFAYPFTRAITSSSFIICLPLVWTAIFVTNLYQLFRIRQKMADILEDVLQPIPEANNNPVEH